jgi:hypothetical protein
MKLSEIQQELKAPKSQYNKFGKYKYRNCEDILTAVKPLLGNAEIILTDEVVLIGERYYIKATAIISENGTTVATATGLAREPENRKGMDESQLTGAASSYARKYALGGLLGIGSDEPDADERVEQEQKKADLNPDHPKWKNAKKAISEGKCTIEDIKTEYELSDINTNLLCSE